MLTGTIWWHICCEKNVADTFALSLHYKSKGDSTHPYIFKVWNRTKRTRLVLNTYRPTCIMYGITCLKHQMSKVWKGVKLKYQKLLQKVVESKQDTFADWMVSCGFWINVILLTVSLYINTDEHVKSNIS